MQRIATRRDDERSSGHPELDKPCIFHSVPRSVSLSSMKRKEGRGAWELEISMDYRARPTLVKETPNSSLKRLKVAFSWGLLLVVSTLVISSWLKAFCLMASWRIRASDRAKPGSTSSPPYLCDATRGTRNCRSNA